LQIVLGFPRIKAGNMRLESIGFSLDDTLRDTIRSLAIHATRRALKSR
jgi:hypothetical protein